MAGVVKYVLDTCILQYLTEPQSDAMRRAVHAWYATVNEDELYVGVGTVFEQKKNAQEMRAVANKLTRAADATKRKKKEDHIRKVEGDIATLVSTFSKRILAIDTDAALEWGAIVAGKNSARSMVDGSLAAVAKARGFAIVTVNVDDFKGHKVLVLDPRESPPVAAVRD
jgi:predicted nucleic acid-binding protein